MKFPDFLSERDTEKYLKVYKENVDTYLEAFSYVRDKLPNEDLDVVYKITNEVIIETNYDFAQIYPEYKTVADLGDIPDYRRLYAQANKKKTKKKVETFSKFKDKK